MTPCVALAAESAEYAEFFLVEESDSAISANSAAK
jgi:hypothetical protein